MPEYRRAYVPGGTLFFTLVTHRRRPLFAELANVNRLRRAVAEVRAEMAFDLVATVVLPDHLHWMVTLPVGDADYSGRIGRIKRRFTQLVTEGGSADDRALTLSRRGKRESGVWQRRFWEHVIRDQDDFNHHLDYIHFNPVKHGLARCPHAWATSSFHRWVAKGAYAADWCCACDAKAIVAPYPAEMDGMGGE